jgi:hypothetical protein
MRSQGDVEIIPVMSGPYLPHLFTEGQVNPTRVIPVSDQGNSNVKADQVLHRTLTLWDGIGVIVGIQVIIMVESMFIVTIIVQSDCCPIKQIGSGIFAR